MDENWMVDEVAGVPGVRHAVVASSDGMVKAHSAGTGPDDADWLAAACSGLHSLGQGIAGEFGSAGGNVRQIMVEVDGAFLFVRTAGEGSRLAVVTEAVVDPGLVAQQMQAQVLKIGERALGTPARGDDHT